MTTPESITHQAPHRNVRKHRWRSLLATVVVGVAALTTWAWSAEVRWHHLAPWGLMKPYKQQKLVGESRADWYTPLGGSCEYIVILHHEKRSVEFWFRLNGKSRGADGKDLMGMFAASEGGCAVPDGMWELPNRESVPVCEVGWCSGQICSVVWYPAVPESALSPR